MYYTEYDRETEHGILMAAFKFDLREFGVGVGISFAAGFGFDIWVGPFSAYIDWTRLF